MFDFLWAGPISVVSAGQYMSGLLNETFIALDIRGWVPRAIHHLFNGPRHVNENFTSVIVAVLVTLYFWWENIKGIEESSDKALKVMKITTVMVVILLAWAIFSLVRDPRPLPPWPTPGNLHFTPESLGFIPASFPKIFGIFGIMMSFGHSFLPISGDESLAQVYL